MESNARARTLGAELRDLRKVKRVRMVQLEEQVGISKSMLSRIERGERLAAETEVATILGALGVAGAKRRELLALAREAAKSNWLATGSGLPQQLKALVEYERVAVSITDVTSLVIPGLLQTPDYIRAIMTEGGLPHAEAEERLRLRLDRQEVLTREDPVQYLAIIDEFVLRRPVGGRSVMADQARHLLALAERDNVTIRVVPEDRGWHPGLYGSFEMLETARTSPVVHLEHLRSSLLLDKLQDVQAYLDIKPTLLAASANVEDSMGLILQCAEFLEGHET
ncbi:transcriptional regulator with XRE-family HTH domain [Saccharothrix tamanrassetensis]|uniref:Transcriptional regulator with XRE-family HTH domain n=1 Tax=Saccharothrix tamanrassetensis TaxID=1051531 RepID=A0A841CJH3_9PSEU|nr:helix-turn-helix transcriptional regulator [Saccharothrix tamanrassetensis]MBB5956328.1 transcriptional regulator with XRE-family HTH domain [Saccharothrix tamanrassetensis]